MKRYRAIRCAVWSSVTLAALGCAQIAGLTEDYRLASGGAGGQAAAAGRSSGGASGAAHAGSGGEGQSMAGDAGASGGEAGSSGGDTGAGGASPGGSNGVAGAAGSAVAGAGGGAGADAGPVRVGFSEFHDSASGGDQASSELADATFMKPAGTSAGDFILVFFGSDHELQHLSGMELSAAGWKLLDQQANYGGDGQGTYLIYKFAGPNEPSSYVFSGINNAGGGNGVQGLLSVYRGVNTAAPINGYEEIVVTSGAQGTSHFVTATPAITTTLAHCLLIAGLSPDTTVDAPVVTSWPAGFSENQVSVLNPPHPYPNGWANIYSAERHLVAAGTVPASAFGWDSTSGTQYYGSMAFVLALSP